LCYRQSLPKHSKRRKQTNKNKQIKEGRKKEGRNKEGRKKERKKKEETKEEKTSLSCRYPHLPQSDKTPYGWETSLTSYCHIQLS
jgi:hypothetical protein